MAEVELSNDPLVKRFLDFTEAGDVPEIHDSFLELCRAAELEKEQRSQDNFYVALKQRLPAHHKPSSLFELLDKRATLKEYKQQNACRGTRVLVVGAGPVGLRAAVEAVLLGAKVDLVEKRSSFTRNNVLHLWPFLVHDLKALGIKKFVGQFGAGGIDHISILKLQCFLLKVCLLLGVRFHPQVTFESLLEPKSTSESGWKVKVSPSSCLVSGHTYDAIIAADGKKHCLPDFPVEVFRANLAIGITANFVIRGTEEEAAAEEIAGVSSHFHPGFFKSLKEKHDIHLENIVYYRDKTHYFVMTAKRDSLLARGVIKQHVSGGAKELLAESNIDHNALEKYAIDAATFATKGNLGKLEFVRNQRNKHDVSIFDFTSLSKAKHAARIVERKNRKILLCIAGDSLNEPFWPTGSGIAHGFLGAYDAAWMLKGYAEGVPPLELIEEREAIFRILPSTTSDKMPKGDSFTIDPSTRYPRFSDFSLPGDVSHLYDTDKPTARPPAQPAKQEKKPVTINAPEKPKRNRSFTPRDRDNHPAYKEIQEQIRHRVADSQPSSAQPPSSRPSSAQPSSTQPSSTRPSTARPSSARPSSAQTSSTRPSSSQPSSSRSSSSRPTPSQPAPPQPRIRPKVPQQSVPHAKPLKDKGLEKKDAEMKGTATSPGMWRKFKTLLYGLFKKSPPSPVREGSSAKTTKKVTKAKPDQREQQANREGHRGVGRLPTGAGGNIQDRIQFFSQGAGLSPEGGTSDDTSVVPKGLVAGRTQAFEDVDAGMTQLDGEQVEEEEEEEKGEGRETASGDEEEVEETDGMSVTELEELVEVYMKEFEPPLASLKVEVEERWSRDDISVSLPMQLKVEVPQWQVKFMNSLTLCLKKLQTQTDLIAFKETLDILNFIYNNVQAHPEDSSYLCVRLSSKRFSRCVWCFPEAQQFILQSGWIEIDQYIALPLGNTLEIPKQVLDRHIYIVDQLLWSRMLAMGGGGRGGDGGEVLRDLQLDGETPSSERDECDTAPVEEEGVTLRPISEVRRIRKLRQTNTDTLYCSPEASDEEDEENKWTTSFATVSQTKEEEIEEEAENPGNQSC